MSDNFEQIRVKVLFEKIHPNVGYKLIFSALIDCKNNAYSFALGHLQTPTIDLL